MSVPTFEQLVRGAGSEGELDVALGAALIAKDAYASLDVQKLLGQLDALAAPLASLGLGRASAHVAAETLSQHLYVTLGFAGNEADYYDPKNSLLPDVLERRLGIPISLALVYCEVARRLGVKAQGVAFPGHFLVALGGARQAVGDAQTQVLVDPFYGGRILDEAALGALLERVAGQAGVAPKITPEMLAPTSSRTFLSRWLMNLRGIYLSRGELPRALLVVDRLVTLSPNDKGLLRDRGLLAARLGATDAAREDLSRALAMDPAGDAAPELRAALESLDRKPSVSN